MNKFELLFSNDSDAYIVADLEESNEKVVYNTDVVGLTDFIQDSLSYYDSGTCYEPHVIQCAGSECDEPIKQVAKRIYQLQAGEVDRCMQDIIEPILDIIEENGSTDTLTTGPKEQDDAVIALC